MEYLLFLQEIRESGSTLIPDFMLSLSSFAVGVWPVIVIAMFYWVIDRKAGRVLFGAGAIGDLLNGILKLTFCVYRPWIRDTRIEPYGNAKTGAKGYSFPSGHTMFSTPRIGGLGIWFWNHCKLGTVLCFLYVFAVMFSRNYLGCHTLQDVLVGFLMGLVSLYVAKMIEDWTDKDPSRDIPVLITAVIVCIVAAFYYLNKSYPMDYDAQGMLIADPAPMVLDCFDGIGEVAAFYIARYFERRGFDFDNKMHWKDRFIVGTLACIPLLIWRNLLFDIVFSVIPYAGMMLEFGLEVFYIMVIVPWIMKKVHESRILEKVFTDFSPSSLLSKCSENVR